MMDFVKDSFGSICRLCNSRCIVYFFLERVLNIIAYSGLMLTRTLRMKENMLGRRTIVCRMHF